MLQNTGPVLLKTAKVIQNKESPRNCHNQEGPTETGGLTVMRDPGTEKGHSVTTNEM